MVLAVVGKELWPRGPLERLAWRAGGDLAAGSRGTMPTVRLDFKRLTQIAATHKDEP